MKITLLLSLQVLALGMKSHEKGRNRCRFYLRGSGEFRYPVETDSGSFKNSSGALNKTEICTIAGKVAWTNDVVLVLNTSASETTLTLQKNERPTPPAEKNLRAIVDRWETSKLSGNVYQSFKIIFPRIGSNFTLTYQSLKARKFECPQTWQGVRGVELIECTNGRRYRSNCTFLEKMFPWTESTSVMATCGKNSVGAPAWIVKEFERVSQPVFSEYNRRGPPDYIENENIMADICNISDCNQLPDNIQVLTCTNGTNVGSNCTLRCKEGYIPAPHLYKNDGNMFPRIHEEVPLFWTKCRYDPKDGILATWRPQVSTNGLQNLQLRNPKELYLDCLELQVAVNLFLGYEKRHIDFSTARDFKKCPYDDDQILQFLHEEKDELSEVLPAEEESYGVNDILEPSMDWTVPVRTLPTLMLVPDKILRALNDAEWKQAIQNLEHVWCSGEVESLKMALFQRPPVKEPNVFEASKLELVVDELLGLVTKNCICDSCNYPWPGPIEEPDCNDYCIWDTNRGKYKPCGSFTGAKNKKNCLRCKTSVACSRLRFLG